MKKAELLNAPLTAVIAKMGHTDTLAIGDCGLPIRGPARRIDLALKKGIPTLLEVLDTVLTELCVEKAILAEEIRDISPEMHRAILERLPGIPVEYVPHAAFKVATEGCRAVVRTGECTAYANVILVSGVTF